MSKRNFMEIRRDILNALSDGNEYLYGDLEQKVNTNWETIRNHCKDFQIINAVSIKKKRVQITPFGLEILKRYNKELKNRNKS